VDDLAARTTSRGGRGVEGSGRAAPEKKKKIGCERKDLTQRAHRCKLYESGGFNGGGNMATNEEMVSAVRAHALSNYNESGWDYVEEAWDDEDIRDVIAKGDATTVEAAIAAVGRIVGLLDERRRDIEATSF
jgi:hypothetical protein